MTAVIAAAAPITSPPKDVRPESAINGCVIFGVLE
jgi:hypothetical protein